MDCFFFGYLCFFFFLVGGGGGGLDRYIDVQTRQDHFCSIVGVSTA